MRDALLLTIVIAAIPFAVYRPWIGVILWTWLGLMNPHRLTWGIAYDFAFAQIIAIAVFIGIVFSFARERPSLKFSAPLLAIVVLDVWMTVTTFAAIDTTSAWAQWSKVMKIHLMIFVTALLIDDRRKLLVLLWTLVLSLGFYGVKGGLYTLAGGGSGQVLGPPGSFIEGNTEIGLALVMAIPLMRALQLSTASRWIRWGLAGAMTLTGFAVLGTQSRGAFLAATAMAVMLWLRSRNKLWMALAMLLVVPSMYVFMPESWHNKMSTIGEYEKDTSAMGRVIAWQFSWQLAIQRLTGGGFESFTPENYLAFAPDLPAVNGKYQDSHSIYFQMLGHHGFLGLALFLLLLILTWRTASSIRRNTMSDPEKRWALDIASMCQVSLIGFMTAGAFLGLAYFDLFYVLVVVVVIIKWQVFGTSGLEERTYPEQAPLAATEHGRTTTT